MEEIIRITSRRIGNLDVNSVDARDLHAKLGVVTRFNDWMPRRIADLDLKLGADFEKFNDLAYSTLSSANRTDYALTVRAAKHIAMAEGTKAGESLRDYFIECEAKATESAAQQLHAALSDPNSLRSLLLGYTEKVIALEATVTEQVEVIAELEPKAATYDALMESADTYGFRESVKHLHRTTAVTEREVRTLLIDRGWVQRLGGTLMPASYGEQREYVTTRVNEYTDPKGVRRSSSELRITNKGLARLQKLLTRADAA